MIKFSILILSILLFSCRSENETKEYYPVDAWIQSELAQIDSLPVAVFKYRTEKYQTDTVIIDKKDFRELAMGLLYINLNKEDIKEEFEEMVLDEGDNSNISITYTAIEASGTPLRKIQVNIKPGKSNPKSIYAERIDMMDEVRIVRKIIWTGGKSLTVHSTYYKEGSVIKMISEKFEYG